MTQNTPLTPDNQALICTLWTSPKPLNKSFTRKPDGTPDKLPHAKLWTGWGQNVYFRNLEEFQRLLVGLGPTQAISLGGMVNHRFDQARLVLKNQLPANPGAVARSQDCIGTHPEANCKLILFDVDVKDMPDAVRAEIIRLGGVEATLLSLVPELLTAERLFVPSSSTGVYADVLPDRGELQGGHFYAIVPADADLKQILHGVRLRGWARGLSYHKTGGSGQLLEPSIVDTAVAGEDRLVFEAPPTLGPGVHRLPIKPEHHPGGVMVALERMPPDVERLARTNKQQSERAIKAEGFKKNAEWKEQHVGKVMVRTGKTRVQAEAVVGLAGTDQLLDDDYVLELGDGNLIMVGEVLDNPGVWDRKGIPCPIEGLAYGASKATVVLSDGKPRIVSFAHGIPTDFYFARHRVEGYLPAPAVGGGTVAEGRMALKAALTQSGGRMPRPASIPDMMRCGMPWQLALNRDEDPAKYDGKKRLGHKKTVTLFKIGMGTGKTHALVDNLEQMVRHRDACWTWAKRHDKSRHAAPPFFIPLERSEQIDKYVADITGGSFSVVAIKGRDQKDENGERLCKRHTIAKRVASLGLPVTQTLCKTCPFKDDCAYRKHRKDARHADVVVGTHNHAQLPQGEVFPRGAAVMLFDEDPTMKMTTPDQTLVMDPEDLKDLFLPQPAHVMLCYVLDAIKRHTVGGGRVPHFDTYVDGVGITEAIRALDEYIWDHELPDPDNDAAVIAHCKKYSRTLTLARFALKLLQVVHAYGVPKVFYIPCLKILSNGKIQLLVPKRLDPSWNETPKAVFSGTANPDLLSLAFNGADVQTVAIEPEWPDHVHVRKTTDRSYAALQLVQVTKTEEGEKIVTALPLLHELIEEFSNQTHLLKALPHECLFIAQLDVVRAATPLLHPDVIKMHFNATTGENGGENCRYMMVLGRALPSVGDVEDLAEAAYRSELRRLPPNSPFYFGEEGINVGRWDGLGPPATGVPYHFHKQTDDVLQLIVRGELAQALGRARSVNRTADNPVQIDIRCNMPVNAVAHEYGTHDDFKMTVREQLNARGVDFDPRAHGGYTLAATLLNIERRTVAAWLDAEQVRHDTRQHYETLGVSTYCKITRPPAPNGSSAVIDGLTVTLAARTREEADRWAERHGVTLDGWQAKDDSVESLVRHLARQPVDQMRTRGNGAGTLRGQIGAYLKMAAQHPNVTEFWKLLKQTKRFRSERRGNGDFAVF